MHERIPGSRLITQNMLASASLYEREENLGWASIQDLSAFIDLFCLYDRAVVIGRGGHIALNKWGSVFLDLISDKHFVDVEYPYETGKEAISMAASKHLVTFLGEQEASRFHNLLAYALTPGAAFSLEETPDGTREINVGQEWLLSTPSRLELLGQLDKEQEVIRGTTFLVRTFLYLAYADVAKIAFTPDAVRCPVLEAVLGREEQFRGELLSKIKSSWKETPGNKDLLSRVSPFSAIVFMRAYPNKKKIVPEMEKLRNELAPVRQRLRDIEDRLLWRSRDEALNTQSKWTSILAEIEQNFGVEPQLVNLRRGLNFGEKIGKIVENPTSLKSWFETMFGLPVEIATRLIHQGPVIEIHRLKTELPATSRLGNAIQRLFGPKMIT